MNNNDIQYKQFKVKKVNKQQSKEHESQQHNNYILFSPKNNEVKNKNQISQSMKNKKIIFEQLENIQLNNSQKKKHKKQISSIGFQQLQTKKKSRKKVKSIDQNIFTDAQQKHFILPLYKKLSQKDKQKLKQYQKTKKNFSNLSSKFQDKNKQSNSMILFILSKNLDKFILDKIEKNQSDKKEEKQNIKLDQQKLNISTPHGNLTLESAFTKPHIVINNFLISQNKIDDLKPKRFKSKQNSPRYNKIKPNKSQKKNILQKYFDKNKFAKFSKKNNRKTQRQKSQKNQSCKKQLTQLNLEQIQKNNEKFFIQKKKHIISKILDKKSLLEQEKNIGKEFRDIFKKFKNEQKTNDLQNLVENIQREIKETNQIPKSSLKYYKIIKLLGKGSFGKVFLGLQKLTNRLVAIKCIKLKNFKDQKKKKILQEVKISQEFLGHPNIIKILEVFENKKYIFFVMEYAANGDLLSFLKQKKRLDENDAKYMFFQICVGLRYIHSLNIIHRDIKLDNILLDDNYRCKICDFGVSRKMKLNEYITEQCGTPAYLAPEIIQNIGYKNFSADIWSLGVLLYSLVTGNMPFRASSLDQLQKKILVGEFEIPKSLNLSEELKDLLTKMLEIIPKKRISIDQILQHKWLSEINFNSLTMINVKQFEKNSMLKGFKPQVNDFVLVHTEDLGFPKNLVIQSITQKKLDLASACYFNIEKDFI